VNTQISVFPILWPQTHSFLGTAHPAALVVIGGEGPLPPRGGFSFRCGANKVRGGHGHAERINSRSGKGGGYMWVHKLLSSRSHQGKARCDRR